MNILLCVPCSARPGTRPRSHKPLFNIKHTVFISCTPFFYELEVVVGEKVAAMVRKLNTVLESWQVCKCILQQMMLGFVSLYAVQHQGCYI